MATTKKPKASSGSLKAEDCIKIIKAAKEADIAEIHFSDLHIKFNKVSKESEKPQTEEQTPVQMQTRNPLKTKEEVEMEKMDELMLSDPLAWEEELYKNEVEGEQVVSLK